MLHTVASLPGPERSKCLSSLSDGWRHRELLGDGPDKPSQLPGSGHDGGLWRCSKRQNFRRTRSWAFTAFLCPRCRLMRR